MASEVAAAKILCEANRRRKLGELGQNFHLADTPQPLLPSPMTPRPQNFGNQMSLCLPRQLSLNDQNSRHTPNSSVRLQSASLNPSRNPLSTGERPATKDAGTMTVSFAESTNAKDWSFSNLTGKLYAAKNKRINIQLSDPNHQLQLLPDKENCQKNSGFFIRFLLVYGSDQHVTRPVVRCQPHLEGGRRLSGSPNQVIDLSPASRFPVGEEEEHVVRCHNAGAQHVRDQISGRYSVVVPVLVLPVQSAIKLEYAEEMSGNQGSVEVDLSFGCLNTCLGAEYSLRNWNIIITLEQSDHSIIGRRLVPVKVCAAPKRERSVEEENLVKGRSKRSRTSQNFEDFDENSRKSFPLGPQESPKTNNELVSKLEPPPVPTLANNDSSQSGLSLSVDTLEELELLTRLRDELRSSPMLRAFMQAKLEPTIPSQ